MAIQTIEDIESEIDRLCDLWYSEFDLAFVDNLAALYNNALVSLNFIDINVAPKISDIKQYLKSVIRHTYTIGNVLKYDLMIDDYLVNYPEKSYASLTSNDLFAAQVNMIRSLLGRHPNDRFFR